MESYSVWVLKTSNQPLNNEWLSDLIETGHASSPRQAGMTKAEIMRLFKCLLLSQVSGFEEGNKKGNCSCYCGEKYAIELPEGKEFRVS